MFGSLRIHKCGLQDSDRDLYKAHFCSVCHNLHRFSGWDSSLLTNYDVTLWSLVASGVSAESYILPVERRRCTAFPAGKVGVQPLTPEVGASLAAITVLLAWAKVEDCAQDGERVVSALGRLWLGRKEKKAESYLRSLGYPLESLLQLPARQLEAEKQGFPTLDDLSAPTEKALSDAFFWVSQLARRPDLERSLRILGQSIARYVYLWDALQDLAKDKKSGDFNAILTVWGEAFPAGTIKSELLVALGDMERELSDLPLGNRRALCLELVKTLRGRVMEHPRLKGVKARPLSPRRNLPRAGFMTPACDCDCGDGCCCDSGCCDTDCGGGCCEIGCCDLNPGDSCCEINCCSFDTCGCCCGGDSVRESASCCTCDCCCEGLGDSICCWSESSRSGRSRGLSGITERDSSSTNHNDDQFVDQQVLLCPGCRRDLVRRNTGSRQEFHCSSCRGVWMDLDDFQKAMKDNAVAPLLSEVQSHPPAPIGKGQRMCPRCNSLLRSPGEPSEPDSCLSCGGRFFCS